MSPRLAPTAAAAIRAAIRMAGGREVCFAATVDEEGNVVAARVVARGDASSVLALPGFARRGEMLVHNHPSGLLEPSPPDLRIAAAMHDEGIGFAIVNNDATELYVVVEVPRVEEEAPVPTDEVGAILSADGPIARRHERYEDRPSQRAMAETIARLYNDGGVGLLEAGTGVGKSLGYLVPALRWAKRNNERTVVSTNTINLQEQLVGKDLPFLRDTLRDQKVRYVLLKGWRNYLCLVRLEQAKAAGPQLLDDGQRRELESVAQWAEKTKDGSVADMPSPPRSEVWDEVAAEPDLCLRTKCPVFDRCFVYKARREAAQADVVVVNHHLLMADLAVRRTTQNWEEAAVLPAYDRLIVDEGHHLEDAAAAHLGAAVSGRALTRLFNRLDRKGKGLLAALEGKLAAQNDLLSVASLDLVKARLAPAVHGGREKAAHLFDLLDTMLQERNEGVTRLTDAFVTDRVWKGGLETAMRDTLGELALLDEGLRLVRERLESDTKREEALAPLLNEMRGVSRRLQSSGDALRRGLLPDPAGQPMVRWVEVRGKERNVSVSAVPLDLAPVLREDLFGRVKTAVITSATLSTGGRFEFLASRLGLDDGETPTTGVFPSPFDYPRQALLAIPNDFAAPNADAEAHLAQVLRATSTLVRAAEGGVFALFTSHRDVRRAAEVLRAEGIERYGPLLVHGEDTRDALLRRFRDSGNAVLLGTASFWEGVDVPGFALRGLVIAKIPFRVPSEPVTAAQCESIQARGGDSFAEYMLPHASLRLKQGFGRLVRTAGDRGVVLLCDPRMIAKRYGRELLDELPPARRLTAPWRVVQGEIASFYAPLVRSFRSSVA